MRRETVEIGDEYGTEYKGRYVFHEITWAKRSRILQKHTKYSQLTGQVVSSDYVTIQAETIWASLKEQPEHKPITLETLLAEEDGIPIELGELFSKVVNRLNSLSVEETRFLSEQSEDKSLTQPLQSTDSAPNSSVSQPSLEGSRQKPSNNSL